MQSFVFRSACPFDPARLEALLRDINASRPKDPMRYKGIVAFEDMDHRVVF